MFFEELVKKLELFNLEIKDIWRKEGKENNSKKIKKIFSEMQWVQIMSENQTVWDRYSGSFLLLM